MICRSRSASEAEVRTYVRYTIVSEPAMNSVAYQTPRRRPYARAGRSRSGADDIADASHRVQQLFLERPIDLLAQTAHQDIDDVGLRIEAVIPDVRQDHRLRDDLAGVAHEIFEQGELAGT